MQQSITIRVSPAEAESESAIRHALVKALNISENEITGFTIQKKSIDARGKVIWINLMVKVFSQEPFLKRSPKKLNYPDVSQSPHRVIIIGGGPAGLFAALKLIEEGVKPIVLERGKDVRSRRRDLALLNKEGIINPESNYCFGEGGAGTYSDGKLYTRSNKRGDIDRVLNIFVQFGAEEKILYEAHPHIGTNKLPQIITAMRQQILNAGGDFHFEKKLTDFTIKDDKLTAVITSDGERFEADTLILATGHSARDIYELLYAKKILIEAKPFALGVRIEHPQSLIDNIQYHAANRGEFLPPASYSLVEQVSGHGVFSFCMCPGGIIAPASTSEGELVVNGWSPSKRNNPFANSGMVVSVEQSDIQAYKKYGPLAGMYFQKAVEQNAFEHGGGNFVAPAQRLTDFVDNRLSSTLPVCSYVPGIRSSMVKEVLPGFISDPLREAFKQFGKKMKGYLTSEAVIVATESRSSSPIRIPRDNVTLAHPQISNLYPCSEGAGYAGGIVSAAMDGEKIASRIISIKKPGTAAVH